MHKHLITIALMGLFSVAPSFGMGRFFEESVHTDPNTGIEEVSAVPTAESQGIIKAIDTAGDAAGAVGIPFLSQAGEIAAGILTLTSLILTARLRETKKANRTMVKGIESGTTDGTIKKSILKQSIRDGTTATIHKAVSEVA